MKFLSKALLFSTLSLAALRSDAALIANWSGDGNALDPINGNNGTLHNGVAYATGKWGQAFSFDSVNDYMVVPDSVSLDSPSLSNALTISAWVKWNGVKGGTTNFNTVALKAVNDATYQDPWYTYALGIRNNGQISLFLSTGTANQFLWCDSAGTIAANGQWYHIAGTYDGQTIKIYINGVLAGTKTGSLQIGNREGSLYVGRDFPTGPGVFWGAVDQLEIYDAALTAEQVQERLAFNLPPTANAGPDRIEYVGTDTQTTITLSGALSSDPENHALTYVWSGPFGTTTGISPTVTLPLGIHEVELDVADQYNQTSTTMMHIAVVQGVNAGGYATMQAQLTAANNQVATVTAQNAVLTAKNALLLSLLETLRAKFVQIQTTATSGIEAIDAVEE